MHCIVTVTDSVGCYCEYPSPRNIPHHEYPSPRNCRWVHPVPVSDSLPNITLAFKTFEFRF